MVHGLGVTVAGFGLMVSQLTIDSGLVGSLWEGYHVSRKCSRDTYPESYITKYTSMKNNLEMLLLVAGVRHGCRLQAHCLHYLQICAQSIIANQP